MHGMAGRRLQREPAACEQGTYMCSTCVRRRHAPAPHVAAQIDDDAKSSFCTMHPMAVMVNLRTRATCQHVSAMTGCGKEAAGTREHKRRANEVVDHGGLLRGRERLRDDRRATALDQRRSASHQVRHEPEVGRGRWRRAAGGIGQGLCVATMRLLRVDGAAQNRTDVQNQVN